MSSFFTFRLSNSTISSKRWVKDLLRKPYQVFPFQALAFLDSGAYVAKFRPLEWSKKGVDSLVCPQTSWKPRRRGNALASFSPTLIYIEIGIK